MLIVNRNFYIASSYKPYASNRNAYDYIDYDTFDL